jgi:hypothetical protein
MVSRLPTLLDDDDIRTGVNGSVHEDLLEILLVDVV